MVHPLATLGPPPHEDMPDDVRRDFAEARGIGQRSPRGAAALLRLCVQKMMLHLGQPGENINDDIAALVAAGLPVEVQQALDAVRVIGNESVHPGEMALEDDLDTAETLFALVNLIVEDRIAKPKMVRAIYAKLPDKKRKAIEARDRASPSP